MNRILIIEDNNEINDLLSEMLGAEGYEADRAYSGTEALLYFEKGGYDLVLLDLMLPGISGEEVLKMIRAKSDTPVIVISAKTEIDGKVELLKNGADDYITKPFDVREVLARVELQLNRHRKTGHKGRIVMEELALDEEGHMFYVNDHPIALTKQEFSIIGLFMKHPDKIYSKQELYELAWEEYYIGEDKTINVHISNIRKKIGEYSEKDYIDTVWGIGYRLKRFNR